MLRLCCKQKRWLFTIIIGSDLLVLVHLSGCRALESRRPDKRVVQARQLSLQGVELLSRNQAVAAEECFTNAIKQCPSDERAHWGISQTLWDSNQKDKAILHMQEAVRLSGQNPDYMVRLGEMYIDMQQIPEARQLANEILENHRDNAQAWAVLGNTWVYEREWDAAMQAFHRSLLIQPDNPPVQLAVSEIYRQTGRPHRSLATIDRVADHHPSMLISGEIQLAKGLALADMGRHNEAAVAFAAASQRLKPDDLPRQIQLAAVQHQMGNFSEAKVTLARILEVSPADPTALRLQSMLDLSFDHLAAAPLSEGVVTDTQSLVR